MSASRTALAAGGAMLVVYALTLAPSVTFWDAGEFIAAARVLGIPHPPGTPLFLLLLNAWARLFSFLPFAVATNLFSAVCTASAVAMTAVVLARALPAPWMGLAAITAGAMSSVWQNATETEVYAASLALSIAVLLAGDSAGRTGERRWIVLTAYLIALSIPLHLSALVAAPAAVYLAARRPNGDIDWTSALTLSAVAIAVLAVSRLSVGWGAAAVLLLLVGALAPGPRSTRSNARVSLWSGAAAFVALSAVLFLLLRARYDPPINQGNPATWSELGAALARRQYAVAGLWPRQAPIWLQAANWFEYADWQFALSLGPSVTPTIARIAATLAFAALGIVGMRWHRRVDRRSWTSLALLFLGGSVGVLLYLNLKAGSSFAWQIVPSDAAHEARDRDYFFVLGFWVWGVWAGLGAFRIAERLRFPRAAGVALAALPIALNWLAVDRREEPGSSLPREVASALLDSLPSNAVLFVNGDNDTYPLWYAQQVDRRRRDVTIVTIPLLAAPWYPRELARRHGLTVAERTPSARTSVELQRARGISWSAHAQRRPVAVALTVPAADRAVLGDAWTIEGMFAVTDSGPTSTTGGRPVAARVDTERVRQAMMSIESWRHGRASRSSTDPVNDYFLGVLSCPSLILRGRESGPIAALRDSTCNIGAP